MGFIQPLDSSCSAELEQFYTGLKKKNPKMRNHCYIPWQMIYCLKPETAFLLCVTLSSWPPSPSFFIVSPVHILVLHVLHQVAFCILHLHNSVPSFLSKTHSCHLALIFLTQLLCNHFLLTLSPSSTLLSSVIHTSFLLVHSGGIDSSILLTEKCLSQ